MSRKFRSANYEETLNETIRLGDALPAEHLARFVVDIIAQLNLSKVSIPSPISLKKQAF